MSHFVYVNTQVYTVPQAHPTALLSSLSCTFHHSWWITCALAQRQQLITFLLRCAVLEILSGVTPRSERTFAIPRASTPQLGATLVSHRRCTFILHTAWRQKEQCDGSGYTRRRGHRYNQEQTGVCQYAV